MRETEFKSWMLARGYAEHSIDSDLSRLKRVEAAMRAYGLPEFDLDSAFKRDGLASIIAAMEQSLADLPTGKEPPKALVPRSRNFTERLTTALRATRQYAEFLGDHPNGRTVSPHMQAASDTAPLSRFYRALEKLGPVTRFAQLDLAALPQRGVYFFFEEGEDRAERGLGPRVVRVGTHALTSGSKSTLAQRLRQHRGSARGGNHRGSIFRLLVGQALLAGASQPPCPSWGVKGQSSQAADILSVSRSQLKSWEDPIEAQVSQVLARMSVAIFGCDDEPGSDSLRGYVERNAIALLSAAQRAGHDRASAEWLGHHSNRNLVVAAGLWNQRHTTKTADPGFLDRFERMVGSGSPMAATR